MSKPTDRFGSEVKPGDAIVYPIKRHGGGGQLREAVIKDIIPLVPWNRAPLVGQTGFMRADQAERQRPTFFPDSGPYADPEKQYVLRCAVIEHWGGGDHESTFTVHRLVDVVKVPQ